ncbi:hypothetical protein Tco_0761662 [Tanacetum coccineum]
MKNKVEAQPRKVNKNNHVVEPIRDVNVKHLMLNANSELIYATCNKSMFDGIYDLCLLDFVKNVNGRSKSAKKACRHQSNRRFRHVAMMVVVLCGCGGDDDDEVVVVVVVEMILMVGCSWLCGGCGGSDGCGGGRLRIIL